MRSLPQFLIETPQFKALVVGLEAGGQIPVDPGQTAVYYFLEGEGLMMVGEETFEVQPGITIVAPSGAKHSADTPLVAAGLFTTDRIHNPSR